MVHSSSMLFKVPGSKTWCGMETLDKARIHPDTLVEIKDVSVCRYKASHGYGERVGKMPLRDAKLKYSI